MRNNIPEVFQLQENTRDINSLKMEKNKIILIIFLLQYFHEQ